MKEIIEASLYSLRQLKVFLIQINQEQYTKSLEVFSGSTLGMHTRHILEFYQCLFAFHENKIVDFDKRMRNPKIESNLNTAFEKVENIMQHLVQLNMNSELKLAMNISVANEKMILVDTNLERELIYLLEHTIHHMAILKMGCLVDFKHIVFEEYFGVAYSTIKFRKDVYSNILT
jgi:hypothetical protein